jgi:hypothetical protein
MNAFATLNFVIKPLIRLKKNEEKMLEITATQNKSIKDNYRMNEAHDNENN